MTTSPIQDPSRTLTSLVFNVDNTIARANKRYNAAVSQQEVNGLGALKSPEEINLAVPEHIDFDVRVNLPAATLSGFKIDAKRGTGKIRVVGTLSQSTLTSGSNEGTAGASTTTTALYRPTASDAWTSGNLAGKLVIIDSGGGAGEIRPILSNGVDSAVVHAISGLDSTSVFRIVEPGTTINSRVDVTNCDCDVEFYGIHFTNKVYSYNNSKFIAEGCKFTTAETDGNVESVLDTWLDVKNSTMATEALISSSDTRRAWAVNIYGSESTVRFTGAQSVRTEFYCTGASTTGLTVNQCLRAQIGFNAQSCTSTPLEIKGCQHTDPYATGIQGSGNTGDYGAVISEASWVDLIGNTTLSGSTADLQIQGFDETYADIAANGGAFWAAGTGVVSAVGTGVFTPNWMTVNQDQIIGGSWLLYGFFRKNGQLVTAAGTNLATSANIGANDAYINAGTGGVKFQYAPTSMGAAPRSFRVINGSGVNINLYPDSASNTINGGAAGTPVVLTNGQWAECVSVSGTDWRVKVY